MSQETSVLVLGVLIVLVAAAAPGLVWFGIQIGRLQEQDEQRITNRTRRNG